MNSNKKSQRYVVSIAFSASSLQRLCILECPGGQPQALFESHDQLSDNIPMLLCTVVARQEDKHKTTCFQECPDALVRVLSSAIQRLTELLLCFLELALLLKVHA
jgi:hypothetical protein